MATRATAVCRPSTLVGKHLDPSAHRHTLDARFTMPRALVPLLIVAALLGPRAAVGQEGARYTLAVRGVPLDAALERFAEVTGTPLAYDPALVDAHRAYCVAEREPAERLLACLLDVSGLDYVRLSSGTYVLVPPAETASPPGHLVGRVVDGAAGGPLPGAHVYLADAGRGAVADADGRFVVADLLPGRHAVQVSYLGYVTWRDTLTVAAARPTRAEAALAPETVLVTPVVVDGLRQRLASEALGRSTVDAATEEGQPAAFRAVAAAPGVRAARAGLHVQGGDVGGYVLTLDGVPVYQPALPGLDEPFAPAAVDRYTVEKAGFDAALGSRTDAVVRAEHALGADAVLDVRADPLALDGRVQAVAGTTPGPRLAVMTAARLGLWGRTTPRSLRHTLADWSRPDLFLLDAHPTGAGPLRAEALVDEEPREVGFADLHAAARLRTGPLRTLYASAYAGHRAFGGAHDGLRATAVPQYDRAPLFTAQDQYRWHNRLAQVRYDAVLGRRTLVSLQARAGTYRLEHDYRLVDSLRVEAATGRLRALGTHPVRDGNGVTTLALEASLDHARGDHQGTLVFELGRTVASFDLYGPRLGSEHRLEASGGEGFSDVAALDAPLRGVAHRAAAWRPALAATDRWRPRPGLALEGGVRLTYVPARRTVYAEPRLALRLDGRGPLGGWAARTAAGLYRQFDGHYRFSVLDVGALLPALDVWLPTDGSVRPPVAYHLAHDLALHPHPRLALHLDAYLKHWPHLLVPRYASAAHGSAGGHLARQRAFLADAEGHAWGLGAGATWTGARLRAEVRYERAEARRRADALFEGRSVPVPWNAPHRGTLGLDARVTPHLTAGLAVRGTWGRTWAFRPAYYDYFGHDGATRRHGPYDLGRPERHHLPPLLALDAHVAYTRPVAGADLQLRLDVRDVTDHRGILDYRLERDGDGVRRVPRRTPGRLPLLALRLVL